MTRIVLLGPDGQVGWELQRSLAPLGDVSTVSQTQVDFEDSEALRSRIRACRPDVIVNAAAYTAVDKAESEPHVAMRVNADGVRVLAEEAERLGALLVHYSTDYVFDGAKDAPYTEDDAPSPLSVYGRTKLAGERVIETSGCRHLIFRTSWVYGMHGGNFAKTILRLAQEREELKVVDDQIGAPTSAELLADVTALCATLFLRYPAQYPGGLYQVVASGHTSWHGYARYVTETARELGVNLKLMPDSVKPVPSSQYLTAAQRPLNSRLATDKVRAAFGLEMPHWKTHLGRFIAELSLGSR